MEQTCGYTCMIGKGRQDEAVQFRITTRSLPITADYTPRGNAEQKKSASPSDENAGMEWRGLFFLKTGCRCHRPARQHCLTHGRARSS